MKQRVTIVVLVAALLAAGAAWAEDPEAPPSATPAEAAPAESSSDGMSGAVHFLIGQTYLSDFWKPVDEPAAFGVEVDFGPSKSIVHVALGWNASVDSGTVATPYFGRTGNVSVGLLEFSAGFLVVPVWKAPVRPYFGAGALRVFASTDSGSNPWNGGDNDQSFGFYGNVGIFFKVGDHFDIGFDGRIVRGTEINLIGVEGDAD